MDKAPASHLLSVVNRLFLIFLCTVLVVAAVYGGLTLRKQWRINTLVGRLQTFSQAFFQYKKDKGLLPADSYNNLPPGMEKYIDPDEWEADAYGGHYNWEGPYWGEKGEYDYAGIALFGTAATMKELILIDRKIDDGNLATGKFRQTLNGRYTYVLEEKP